MKAKCGPGKSPSIVLSLAVSAHLASPTKSHLYSTAPHSSHEPYPILELSLLELGEPVQQHSHSVTAMEAWCPL
jgi:hypothetical protein